MPQVTPTYNTTVAIKWLFPMADPASVVVAGESGQRALPLPLLSRQAYSGCPFLKQPEHTVFPRIVPADTINLSHWNNADTI